MIFQATEGMTRHLSRKCSRKDFCHTSVHTSVRASVHASEGRVNRARWGSVGKFSSERGGC
jgi:hypothetical protein